MGHTDTSQLNMFNTQRKKGFFHRAAAVVNRHKRDQLLLYTEAIVRDVSSQGKLLSTGVNKPEVHALLKLEISLPLRSFNNVWNKVHSKKGSVIVNAEYARCFRLAAYLLQPHLAMKSTKMMQCLLPNKI